MKKIIAILLIAFTLLSFGVCVCAEEETGADTPLTEELEEGGALTAEGETEATASNESFPEENSDTGVIFDAIFENISEILSVLTFAISVILTLLYKKGLMPTLGGALGSINSTVESFSEKAEIGIASAEEAVRRIDGRIEDMGGIIETVSATLGEIDKRIFELEEKRSDGESIRVMMRSQVEELWEIFSSSELSEISKKTLEEKLTVIREHLNSDK